MNRRSAVAHSPGYNRAMRVLLIAVVATFAAVLAVLPGASPRAANAAVPAAEDSFHNIFSCCKQ